MRIVAGRDYYDSALAMGRDDKVVFVRSKDKTWDMAQGCALGVVPPSSSLIFKTTEPKASDLSYPRHKQNMLSLDGFDCIARPVTAFVAGKFYSGIEVDASGVSKTPEGPGSAFKSDFNLPGFHNSYKAHFWSKEQVGTWLADKGVFLFAFGGAGMVPHTSKDALGEYFQPVEATKAVLATLIAQGVSVLTSVDNTRYGDPVWRVNADSLKDIGFYKRMDAFSVFQELQMWVGGVLANAGNPMVEITNDKVKIAKHGFDVKSSFRKAPSLR